MSPLTIIFPAVEAIGGERRLRQVALAHVEARISHLWSDEQLGAVAETRAYQDFERQIVSDGWPAPTEPLAVITQKHGWEIVSGLFTFLATKRLDVATLPTVFLGRGEVSLWQSAFNRPTLKVGEDDVDFDQKVLSYYG